MRNIRLRHFLPLVLIIGFGLMIQASTPRAQEDQGVLASFISRVLSTPTSRVTVGSVEGPLSSDAMIRDVSVADADGVYLKIDTIRLVWRRVALLSRRLEIQNLEIGRIEFSRRPARDPAAVPANSTDPILPELPLKVEIGRLSVAELVLGEPVIGLAARFSATGNATLGPPAEGLNTSLDIRRLDAPGTTTLKLAFAPATEQLDLTLLHDEPAGGVAARLANLPGLPPVKLDLTGAGRLDDWRARIAFAAGAGTDAIGEARLFRTGALRRLGLRLTAHIENLLPPAVGTVFAGTTALTSDVVFEDSGAYGIENLRLASDLAELTIAGKLDANQILDVTASARALPNNGQQTRRGDGSLGQLVFDASAKGPVARPRIAGRLTLRDLANSQITLGSLTATLSAEPAPEDARQRYGLALEGRAEGLALADRGFSEALGDRVAVNFRAMIDGDSVADISELSATTPNLRLAYAGRAGAKVLEGRARVEITRLRAISRLAGRTLSGEAVVTAALSGNPATSLAANVDGRATNLTLGDPIADRLMGRQATIAGTIRRGPDSLRFESLTLRGQHVASTLNGGMANGTFDLRASLGLPELKQVDPRLAGAAEASAHLAGKVDDPDVSLLLDARDVRALDRPVRDLRLTLAARQTASTPTVTLNIGGLVDGKPLSAHVQAAKDAAGTWTLSRLEARLGTASAQGQGEISPNRLATGRITLSASDLNDLSPLVLTQLRGSLQATIDANAQDGRQRAALQAVGGRIIAGGLSLNAIRANLTGEDLFGRPVVNGDVSIDRLVAGGETIQRIALKAVGTPAGSDLTLSAEARGFQVASTGRLVPGETLRLDLASFAATRQGGRITLTAPASLLFSDGSVRTDKLSLAVLGGAVDVSGRIGSNLDISVAARAVPLAAIDIVAPGTGLRGTLDARATLSGPASAPRGPYEASLRGFSLPQTREAGIPALDITARGEAQGERASVNARIAGGRTIAFDVSGSVPIGPADALDLRGRGTLDAGLLNASLAGSGRRVAGRVAIDGALRGSRSNPEVQGSATLTGGSFSDPLQGVSLTGIEGRVIGRGTSLVIERLTARAKNGGTLTVTGQVDADAQRGFPANLRIAARNAELVSSDVVTMNASLDMTVTGPLATQPRISGRIDVQTLEVRVPDRLPSNTEPFRDARHVAPPPQTRARLAQIARQRATAQRRAAVFNATVDLAIDAPSRVFVRGRGIDAELGGQVRLSGTTNDLRANGAFELRRGRLSLLTQRLDFTRGRVTFGGGDLVPDLDFVAETRATDIVATIGIRGRANEPEFVLSSTPSLPQDEVLSRLLFQRAAGGLSPFQALQLAQAVVQLSGSGSGSDAFERARRALGVDNLDVTTGTSGPAVGVSRAINDRIRLGVRAGSKPENSAVGVDIDLTRRLRIQTEIGADGRASVGVGTELEY
ncbi:hypothetical protein E8L99_11255 [Phreatobacter aquaticus]|uniref:Translocation and assembly module TamB C-terminal domain-containing protein n=1 Tax=Phreatobacter aquaticus TaxID=2570229 RepID=A0A4D7QKQ4_9HYPH|nr:translocation/assembly module TamB domain-containing protein [Phreatobacter aquaticus]QCK86289.1 hypothetical protein E8L99_11255 [Phreatobacter aquaticus]